MPQQRKLLPVGWAGQHADLKKTLRARRQHDRKGADMKKSKLPHGIAAVLIAVPALWSPTQAATPAELMAGYTAQAGTAASPQRGEQFFNATHGKEWSCASCHGTMPTQAGKHASTGKSIGALAPSVNAQRFSDTAKVEKWFRRNCNDVLGRECSAAEKADVMSWLVGLKP
jgi:hypothetical protein